LKKHLSATSKNKVLPVLGKKRFLFFSVFKVPQNNTKVFQKIFKNKRGFKTSFFFLDSKTFPRNRPRSGE